MGMEGLIDGKPIAEIAPQASKNLHGGKKFWLHLAPDNFLPKFCEQIVGQKRGETRQITIVFPADFPVKELATREANYAVTLQEIREKVLPARDDALANKLIPGKTLDDLRDIIQQDLEQEKEHGVERAKEAQIVKYLHEHISFELPPALMKNETRRVLGELVQRNRERGIPDEMLKDKEKDLIESAAALAAHRLKSNFILHRIADGRSHRQPCHCPVAFPADGGLEKGYQHLYQFAGWIGNGRTRSLRHHAVSHVRCDDLLPRHGCEHGRAFALRRHEG